MRRIDEAITSTASMRDGLVRLDELTPLGIGRDALRDDALARRVTRLHRGVYLVNPDDPASPRRLLQGALLHVGPEALLVLRSALHVHGIQGVVGDWIPEVAMPPGLEKRQRGGMELRFWDVPESQRTVVDGLPVTTVARTLADVSRLLPRMQAVACLDSALHLGLISEAELPAILGMMERKRGCVTGRRRVADCRVGAASPLETRVRLRAADNGLAPDALQVPIRSRAGALLGFGDIGYRLPSGSWLIVEADGLAVHELPEALLHDRRRQNSFLADAEVSILRFTWPDTAHPAYIPSVLRPVLEQAGWCPEARRA